MSEESMTIQELRALDQIGLLEALKSLRKKHFILKMQLGNEQVKTTHRLGQMRRCIARIKTILNETVRGNR